MIVHTADILSNAFLAKIKNRKYISELNQAASAKMKTAIRSMQDWLPILAEEINSACRFFMGEESGTNEFQSEKQKDEGKETVEEGL